MLDTHTAAAEYAYQALLENREIECKTRIVFATVNPFKYPQDSMYAVTGEDIVDTFKTIKHLELATAMYAPKSIKALRSKQTEIKAVTLEKCKEYLQKFVQMGL